MWAVLAAGAVLIISASLAPGKSDIGPFENPLGVGSEVGKSIIYVTAAAVFAIFAALVLSALSLVFRYRYAGGIERQQLKWFAFAATLFGGSIVFSSFLGQDLPGAWDALFETVTFVPLYVAVGIAILRYHLYDIDVIIITVPSSTVRSQRRSLLSTSAVSLCCRGCSSYSPARSPPSPLSPPPWR